MTNLIYSDAILYFMVQIGLLAAVLLVWLVVSTEEATHKEVKH